MKLQRPNVSYVDFKALKVNRKKKMESGESDGKKDRESHKSYLQASKDFCAK